MTAQTMAPALPAQIQRNFRLAGPVLGIGVLLLGILFHAEVIAAVSVWVDSTAYNHCFLVLPIVAYLLWDRRDQLALARPVPNAWFALLAIPAAIIWLLAERLGIMEGRQLMAMTLVEIFLLTVLGWRVSWQFSGPLLYLYFLVPFGAFLTPALQGFTTSFIVRGLNLLSIPNYADGFGIEIPEGSFLVAEACAGLRFLIASLAFGCLYALLMYRSPIRRGIFIVISLVVPIIANGFRALGIVVLGHALGNAQAAVADHLIYGWLFFSVVILLQIAFGLPFREDHQKRAAPPRASQARTPPPRQTSVRAEGRGGRGTRRRSLPLHQRALIELQHIWAAYLAWLEKSKARPVTLRSVAIAGCFPLVLATIGPATAMTLNYVSSADLPTALQPITFQGVCVTDPQRPITRTDGIGRLWVEHLKCGQVAFTFRLEVFPPRTSPSRIISELRALSGETEGDVGAVAFLATPEGPRTWRVQEINQPAETVASSLWIDGHPSQVTFDMRVQRAWASVTGSRYAPIAISLAPELDWSKPTVALRNRARDLISLFLQTYQSLPDQITRLSFAAGR